MYYICENNYSLFIITKRYQNHHINKIRDLVI